jgi:hypothetical protein
MSDFLHRLAVGLPLTAGAGVALAVLIAWIFAGPGNNARRAGVGVAYVVVLVGGWVAMLYDDQLPSISGSLRTAVQVGVGALTLGAFAAPFAWRRLVSRGPNAT